MKTSIKLAFGLAIVLGISLSTAHAESVAGVNPAEPRSGWDLSKLGSIPVQAGGRLKPFDSFARDTVLQITGRPKFQGWDPVDLLVSWLVFPKEWDTKEFILITRKDVKRQLGLDEDQKYFTPNQLYQQSFLADYANSLSNQQAGMSSQATPIAKTSKPDPRDQELKTVLSRISLYRAIVTGEAWPVIPTKSPEPWMTLGIPNHSDGSAGDIAQLPGRPIREAFMQMFTGYLARNESVFQQAVATARTEITGQIRTLGNSWSESEEKGLAVETWYNRVHPFQWAWIIYLIAALLWTFTHFVTPEQSKKLVRIALPLTVVGFVIQTVGILIRCYIAGRPPVTNMYESIIWVSYGVIIFAFILWKIQKSTLLFAVACTLGTVGLIIADAAPAMIDPSIHPLVPVLRSNYWLLIHVLTITISYAAFALSLGIGNVTLFHYLRGADRSDEGRKKIAGANLLSYRSIQFGVVLLAAGTILGGIWADYSWGRFWGWDPKEVWALIALMGYLAIIHARYTNWMKPFGFAAWSVISFTLVLMAWYGVNFVLGVGLHSYGFATGGQGYVAIYVLAQLAYVLAAWWVQRRGGAPGGGVVTS